MESIGDARSFLSASREVALAKPIIVIKAGRTEAAAKAAASHTGSLAGSDEVLDAAFRRVGVLRVNSISEVFDMAEVLAKQPRPHGPQAGDRDQRRRARRPGHRRARSRTRGELATLSGRVHGGTQQLRSRPPGATAIPIDILGDADAERYARTLAITTQDPNIDGLLVILTPQAMSDPTGHRSRAPGVRQGRRQAGARELDGRRGGRARRADPRPRGHPDIRVSRCRRASLHAHVAVVITTFRRCTRRRACRRDGETDDQCP